MIAFFTRRLILIALILALVGVPAYFLLRPGDSVSLLYQSENSQLSIKGTYLSVEVVDSAEEHQLGLSNRPNLDKGEGMLFVYERPMTPSFWMKDMKFSIDIIWIGEDKKIVFIHHNVSPETFPQSFQPPRSIKYVLEANAGFAESVQAVPGDLVNF